MFTSNLSRIGPPSLRTGVLLLILFSWLFLASCGGRSSPPPDDVQPVAQTAAPLTTATAAPTLTAGAELPPPTGTSPSPVDVNTNEPLDLRPEISDGRRQQMMDFLNRESERGNFMGSVLVAQGGTILVNDGFGQADVTAGIPNLPQTQFRIGSLTKQLTAAAILKLQEHGALDVQDPVAKYLPDYPRGTEITIHHLLTHTAGIPNYENRPDLPNVAQSPIALDDLISSFANQPLEFPPGQGYQYSSSGYVVLTKIIEVAAGQPYADYLRSQFFDPLNMASSGYDFLSPDLPNPAVGYQLTPGGPRPAVTTDSSWPSGAGAIYSTVGDLYLWDRALNGQGILSEASQQAFFAPYVDTGQGSSYAYGWEIGSMAGHSGAMHGGGIPGFAAFMVRFPGDEAVIIVLSNSTQMPPRIIAENLAQILFQS